MSYSSFKIILIHVKNIIPIITATLILNYLNNSERSLVKQFLIEDEIIVYATYLIPDI
ncbi:protein YmgI [Escherichia coli]|uniref:protein YmgI n=1 Tax=Escherichia coli TaxID=562 RepID=UPI002FBEE964